MTTEPITAHAFGAVWTERAARHELGRSARYELARSIHRRVKLERAVYGAATLGITIAPQSDLWPAHLTAAVAAAGSIAWLWRKANAEHGWHAFIKTCQRTLPLLTGTGLYLTNLVHPGAPWWEYAAPIGWGLTMAAAAPVTRARSLPADPAAPSSAAELPVAPTVQLAPAATYEEGRSRQWADARTTGSTLLTHVTRYRHDLPDFHGIVIAPAGEAVPDLNPTALAAVFDLPPDSVVLEPIPNSGPGRKHLIAAPTALARRAQADDDPIRRLWNAKVSHPKGAAPGMLLADYRTEPNRVSLRVTAPDDQLIQLNQKKIARAFDYKDTSLVMVETDGLGDGLISLYKTHPLMQVREATAEDLTMREDGTIQIGIRPDGRPARMQLYDPQLGALTDLFVGAMGAGKSVTLNTILAAERISGVVSIVADAQNGMSLPEADMRVFHFGKGIAAVAATLAAAYEVAQYREKVSSANGWAGFEINDPWPLANVTLDELNRILSADALVPRPFKKWVVGLVGDFQSTGRKFGMGVRFAAQSIHLADLGDKDKIRANAKNGTVWLGRTNSSTTNHMATDGVIPPGVTLEPIRPNFQTGSDIDAAFTGAEAAKGPRTAGMANMIQGGSVFLSRTFNARKENKTYPGLIDLYESAPIPVLTEPEIEVFTRGYAKWLPFAEELLAGEDGNSEGALETIDPLADDEPEPSAASIKDRILDLLADGPMALKDVRKRLADEFAAGSVNNAMGELHKIDEKVTAVSRGVYQLTQ